MQQGGFTSAGRGDERGVRHAQGGADMAGLKILPLQKIAPRARAVLAGKA
jgi:hypothetical protein